MSLPPDGRFGLDPIAVYPAVTRALLLTVLFAGCSGGSELLLPGDGEPASIQVVHGNELSGRVGEPLGDSLVFEVTDAQRRPVAGARVAFDVTSAGPGADVLPDTAETDANGQTYARMVLGTRIGSQVGEARLVVPEGRQGPTASFTVIALSENANEIVAFSGDNQLGPAGSILGQPLVVQVTDAFGNPISGIPVTWTAEGGGSVSEASNFTDGEGRAAVQRTLGPAAGPQVTLATSGGLAGSPVTFTHTATAGNASVLSLISGNNQTAQAGTRLPADLVVRLVDASGNGVPEAAVTWVVGTGGGSVSPQNGSTDAAGQASARWTLGPNPGQNRVDAVVSGVGVVNFTATGTSSAPASLAILVQPSGSARNGQPFARQPVVQVRDVGGGNATTPGVAVTAQLSGGGGELLGTRQRLTDASGRATFTDLAISGAQGTRVLVFTAGGFGGATSNAIEVSAVPTSTTITSDSPDPSAAGAVVTVGFRVNASGVIPTGSVTVTDGSQSCAGTLTGGSGSCQLTLTTAGQRTLRATYGGAAGLTGSTGTESHRVEASPAGNHPPDADYNWHCDGLTCAFADASSDQDGNVVGWSWNFGDGSTTTEREPTHGFAAPGRYTVTLIVTDDDGAIDQSTADVVVQVPPPGNQAPTAAFTFSCDHLNCSFSSDGTSDSDGRISDFSWTFGDGGTSEDRNPRHSYASANTYTVTLTVTDDDGATSSVAHEVTATPPDNRLPHAEFEVSCTDLTCTFTDRSTDDDGTIVSRSWNYGDGSPPSQETTHTYAAPGTYKVTLTVTDDRGGTDSADHDADAKAPPPQNQAPTPEFSWSCSNLDCSFQDQSTDDRGIASRSWDFGDPASGGNNTATAQTAGHSFSSAGTYTVTLTVTDTDGESRSVAHTFDVTAPPPPNQAPSPEFSWSCSDLNCTFQDQSTDDRGIASQGWDFGDPASGESNTSTGQTPGHSFSSAGTYTVTLTVTDTDAESRSITHTFDVTAPPPPE